MMPDALSLQNGFELVLVNEHDTPGPLCTDATAENMGILGK
jgi:hypothetical protein